MLSSMNSPCYQDVVQEIMAVLSRPEMLRRRVLLSTTTLLLNILKQLLLHFPHESVNLLQFPLETVNLLQFPHESVNLAYQVVTKLGLQEIAYIFIAQCSLEILRRLLEIWRPPVGTRQNNMNLKVIIFT